MTSTLRFKELRITYRARTHPGIESDQSISTLQDAIRFLNPLLRYEASEVFGILCLDTKDHLIAWHEVARGSISGCIVHTREVYKAAFLANADRIIATHNHPSGDPSPSPDDHVLTRKLAAAGVLLGVPLIDHVIVGNGDYFSFRESGLLKKSEA